MQKFIAKLGSLIQGVIFGADRLVFRGSLRAIQYQFGRMGYLWHKQVPLLAFGKHAHEESSRLLLVIHPDRLATDVGFRGGVALQRLFPLLVEHAMTSFSSPDVMRFLGHKVTAQGQVLGIYRARSARIGSAVPKGCG